MARKGILSTDATAAPARRTAADRLMPRGTVGALQSSLSKLQENAVQDLDPALIHDAGVADRLGNDDSADTALRDSLRVYGQQVPVLVRPRADQPGHFDIVYGRRRVIALRELGQTVKAMVRHLDDKALVLAQGQENTARQDLSFIEKASFAAQLDALDYDRQTVADALSIDLPMVSRMLKVGRAFDVDFLRQIGSAPGIGRERWLTLAEALQDEALRDRVEARMETLIYVDGSDTRFEQVLAWATGAKTPKQAKARPLPARKITGPGGVSLAQVKRSDKGLTLSTTGGFALWLDAHAEDLVKELHDRWQKERSED
ncbi:plasmid partitioning protein RepB [Antarctobacter heliothermus]|uniref:Chromosome partitioning protein, ParB family n=1 Tax=Antarctobacter heliothermus TaxID=74033 RepID=A0A239FV36_9RHOB|nr:plasmid partitioning protein RepB [Antarctobacter heliothermus]SNS60665.1 chromosome partitioning protein, ParB family [Antarctobacter heliothermus]